jgi:uncharacterized protein
MHEPVELPYSTCRALLASGVVGRAAVITPHGPRIFTVNYSVVDEAIFFRTTPDSVLGQHAVNAPLTFQVDYFDYEYHRGWSVMATGQGQPVEDDRDVAHVRAVWPPRPWAAGERELYVRLAWEELSGRQLGTGWDPQRELPVRRTV